MCGCLGLPEGHRVFGFKHAQVAFAWFAFVVRLVVFLARSFVCFLFVSPATWTSCWIEALAGGLTLVLHIALDVGLRVFRRVFRLVERLLGSHLVTLSPAWVYSTINHGSVGSVHSSGLAVSFVSASADHGSPTLGAGRSGCTNCSVSKEFQEEIACTFRFMFICLVWPVEKLS